MIDTNIVLDVLLDREPFANSSAEILSLCERQKLNGVITASCVTDIFYIVRKTLHSTEKTYEIVGGILKIINICDVTDNDVLTAFSHRAKDFEDCLVSVCAKANKCDCIVTRNKKDYDNFNIPVFTPDELIGKLR